MKKKRCTKCQEEKPLSEFYKHKAGKDGLTSYCKGCIRRQVSKGYNVESQMASAEERPKSIKMMNEKIKLNFDNLQSEVKVEGLTRTREEFLELLLRTSFLEIEILRDLIIRSETFVAYCLSGCQERKDREARIEKLLDEIDIAIRPPEELIRESPLKKYFQVN